MSDETFDPPGKALRRCASAIDRTSRRYLDRRVPTILSFNTDEITYARIAKSGDYSSDLHLDGVNKTSQRANLKHPAKVMSAFGSKTDRFPRYN
jgi:hypothetical protein